MKVAVYYSNDDIRLEERPIPEIAGGEILVRMMASGICGTDVMEWYRRRKSPRVLGHEMAGEVVDIGKGVGNFIKGDRVFVSHHVPCFSCYYCHHGKHTACEALHSGNYEPGGFAEYIRVPEENVKYGTFLLPESITYEEAVMIEPLGCVVAGQKLAGLRDGETVLIIGSGVSGLLHILLSSPKGLRVIATDINEYRVEKALEFGADHAINAGEFSSDVLRRLNNERLADTVIVCAGAEKAVDDAFSSVDRKGTILFFAVPQRDIAMPSVRSWRDELSIVFSYGAAPEHLQEAMDLMSNGVINVRKTITHRVSLSDIQRGFNLVSEAKESLKVVVVPDEKE